MALRVALYARFSSDLQSAASIEDQLRLCREHAEARGWTVADSYADRAISGATLLRPGIQKLMADAARGGFDIVLSEALDRLSRDQEDIAALFKRLRFARVRIVTLSDGEIGEMHIGLRGTMNAMFLTDLADKTRRGLRGRVESGRSGGGNAYGYNVVRQFGSDGAAKTGERTINETQAEVVRRIFAEFASGKSPRAIAAQLNQEKIPGPRAEGWGPSTINGNAERGTGILNNELYIGRLVWNRQRYVTDPSTGKRVSRPNDPSKWVITQVPELRIIDDNLWASVKERQAAMRKSTRPDMARSQDGRRESSATGFWRHQRPKHLLTGLLRCGVCGGAYSKISATLFGCATARNKGTCDNRLNMRGDRLEAIVLDGLRHRLMDPALFKEFTEAFVAERNAASAQRRAHFAGAREELKRLEHRKTRIIDAIAEGMPASSMREEMIRIEARKAELTDLLARETAPEPSLHPAMAELYREAVANLHEALQDPTTKDEAFGIIRTLIEAVILVPDDGQLRVELRGALAGILRLASGGGNDKSPGAGASGLGSTDVLVSQIKMVAGTGFEPVTFRL
ncbi:recombinase family protein [Acidiphilium multivorum]|uniref:recombinase family protein n=1 Tax=Acidiphilium multivorum TaxID=62140 RepID=UPI001B8C6C5B|nr:recombinase family protein [Acidiphilium multivorum]MBS3025438.1 recombinase family protein [Acidiphilium multivorum]